VDLWDGKALEFTSKNSKPNKTVSGLTKELTALRNSLVVTTGDNYVGTAEDQLREKINEIYVNVSTYFGAPSSSELANIKSLKNELTKAHETFNKLMANQIAAFSKILDNNTTVAKPTILSFEDFLKE
jgi:hypothetical protein